MEVRSMRYAQVRSMDISNGEGIGVSLFVQGCPFNPHCYNCFNSETWDFNGGKEWTPDVKEKFLELVDRQYIKRVSILGGEPLADENLDDVLDLITEINKRYNFQKIDPVNPCKMGVSEDENANEIHLSLPDKTIWLWTGFTWEYIFSNLEDMNNLKRQEIIRNCDVLVDGRYIDSQRDINLKWRGSKNQRVIFVKESFRKGEIITMG